MEDGEKMKAMGPMLFVMCNDVKEIAELTPDRGEVRTVDLVAPA